MLDQLQEMLKQSYAVERELGGGGMSRVFIATDLRLGRRVVIKLVPRELTTELSLERFRREIQIAAKLRHPHIVPLLEAGEVGDTLYYTMPYIEGESMRARLRREHAIPLRESIRLCAEIAGALAYSHQQGIVHRDIKPENILLDSGHAVVTDFGIARAISESNASALTTTGFVGTIAYMSPEQASGDTNLDGRSDVYSLACVLFEMVTGRSPVSAGQKLLDAATHASQFGPLLPVLSKALAVHREQRFETAAQFRDALAKEAAAPRRRYAAALAMGLAVVGGIAALSAYVRRPETTVSWTRRQISAVGTARFPALSADGRFVAYISANGVYVTEVRTGETHQVATGRSLRRPSWTSGGSEVAFQSRDTVYAVPRSGGTPRILLAPANGEYAISADGKRVAWSTKTNGLSTFSIGSLGLSVNAGTVDTVVRRQLQPSILSWSSDGKWLAAGLENGVTIFSSDGSEETAVATRWGRGDRPFPSFVWWLSWSRASDTLYVDGLHLREAGPPALAATILSTRGAWSALAPVDTPANYRASEFSSDRRRFASIVSTRRFQLFRYTLDKGRATGRLPVAAGAASDRHHDFSPDGKTAAFAREVESRREVYVVPADGGIPRRVTSLNAKSLSAVRWSPDGALIAFIYATDTSAGIGVVNPMTGAQRLMRSQLPITGDLSLFLREVGLGWTPDGSRLFFGATHMWRGGRTLGGVGTIDLRSGRDSLLDSSGTVTPIVSPSDNEVGFQGGMLTSFVYFDWRTGRRDSTPLPLRVTPSRWERGGSLLLLRGDSSSTEISRLSLISRRQTPVAVVPSRCLSVSLSIDGRTVVCEEMETEFEVWVSTRDGNPQKGRFPFLRGR
jgi:Tol biopolymer transport system component/tRNA A-37 threonylcarbamoyl transferase component Bud32